MDDSLRDLVEAVRQIDKRMERLEQAHNQAMAVLRWLLGILSGFTTAWLVRILLAG